MEFYALQAGLVTIIALLAIILWRRTHNPSLPIVTAMMYYWSLHGAWGIITDRLGGNSGLGYHYLEQELFPIRLDSDYFWTLSLYGLFIIATLLTTLLLTRRYTPGQRPTIQPVRVSAGSLLILSVLFGAAAIFLTARSLQDAVVTDRSLYSVARPELEEGGIFTFYQSALEIGLFGTFIGLVALIGGNRGLLIRTSRSRFLFVGNLLLLAILFGYSVVAGSKGLMFSTAIFGVLLHLANSPKPRYLLVGIISIAAIYLIISIDILRYYSPTQILGLADLPQIDELTDQLTKSNEAFGAHFSMYGVLSFNVPPTYGLGLESLIQSILPRFAQLVTRGPDLYQYYIQRVGGATGQGFSIHYATGWYLDFGVTGIMVGSILLGAILAFLSNLHYRKAPPRSLLFRAATVVVPAAFAGNFPYIVRGPGIEVIKGALIDSVLLPTAIVFAAAVIGEALLAQRKNALWSASPNRLADYPPAGAE